MLRSFVITGNLRDSGAARRLFRLGASVLLAPVDYEEKTMPVFAFYNLNDPSTTAADSALDDGAQNGIYFNGAASNGAQAVFDGLDDLVKIAQSDSFQLDRGTLEIQFTIDPDTNFNVPRTVLSRDSAGATEGGFRIEVLGDGVIEITHETATGSQIFSTGPGFYTPGDEISLSYSWDFGGLGGTVSIQNLTSVGSYTDDVPNTLTMDMGAINQNWIIGAGQSQSPAGTLAGVDSFFQGTVEYFSISDTVDNTPPPSPVGDGIVQGTMGGDLIDLAYTGDPQGDRIDNNDALLPGEAPQDDIVHAGAGNDTILSGLGNDDITADLGDDLVYGGSGDDIATGDAGRDLMFGDDGNDTLSGGADDDTLFGGDGDDSLLGGDGADDLDGGVGDDTLDGGIGDDALIGGAGNDLASGGDGDDFIDTRSHGGDAAPDRAYPGLYAADSDAFDDRDTVLGGAGNDTILTGDDRDVIDAGTGNDAIDAGDDDDGVQAGAGDDTVFAGEGNDTVLGGDGNDVLLGGTRGDLLDPTHLPDATDADPDNNRDLLDGGAGDDSLYGGDDADTLIGGIGNDLLDGGIDDDVLTGGAGADVMIGGEGADTMTGGADRDLFIGATAGDVVDGSSEGDDFDTLDLRGSGPLRVNYDPANNENGTVDFLDADGAVTGSMAFVEIENVLTADDGDPVAMPDAVTTPEDTDAVIDVLANDLSPDGQPLQVTEARAENGEVNLNSDGTITYTPYRDFNGPDTITYTVIDPDGNTSTSFVSVTVTPVNDVPDAQDDYAETPLNTPVVIDVLANDIDIDGDALSLVGVPTSADGTVAVNPDGTITFTPNAGFTGAAVISYEMTDGSANDTAQAVVLVGLTPRDGIVSGTPGDDLIDAAYIDPTDGDVVDGEDAIIPGDAPNDDHIVAGDGNDTVLSGLGNDTVYAGAGDDLVFGGEGFETVFGGAGGDTIFGGNGQELIFGEEGDDYIDTRGTDAPLPDIDYPGLYAADADPTNDMDTVYGGDGNDTIFTGDDADRVFGRDGNDYIDGGFDNDSLYGNAGFDTIIGDEGNDSIDAGAGNDLIFGGRDFTTADPVNIPDDEGDLRPLNDADFITGNHGDDTIYGLDDDDTLDGGDGNDLIFGGNDDDIVGGGDGNDTGFGDGGNDSLFGDAGDDVLAGGAGDDLLDGGIGSDSLSGDDGDDLLIGADGEDTLDGGSGDDTLEGGVGNDTLIAGTGADSLYGEFGRDFIDLGSNGRPDDQGDLAFGGFDEDTITGVGIGDTVFGGGDGESSDQDTLILRGPNVRVVDLVTDSDGNGFDGTVEFLAADGSVSGTATFTNIENIETIVCFTPGTLIATPKGEIPVEQLRVGDKVVTRDNGLQGIRWMGAKDMGWHDFAANPHLRPIRIRAGSLGNGLPERDLLLSPNHRLLVANDRTALYFDEHEVLVAAKHLIGAEGATQVDSVGTTYIHFMFDQHEVVLSNGAWTESFQPGDYSLKGLGNAQRAELLELFPELASRPGLEGYQAARKTLKKHEALLLGR
jgi:Ca2+-binding RTX toxin-like protein